MRVLLIGVGGVGEAIAVVAQNRPWLEHMVLADYRVDHAREVGARLSDPSRFPAEQIDHLCAGAQTQRRSDHECS